MNRSILSIALCAIIFGYGYFTVSNANAKGTIITTQEGDAQMVEAETTARSYIDQFVAELNASSGSDPRYTLKVGFRVRKNGEPSTEVIWVDNLQSLGDGQFTGNLANEPVWMKGYVLQDAVEFTQDMIYDWGIEHNGKLYGHFSTRVLLQQLPIDQQNALIERLQADPVPPRFEH